MCGRGGIGAQTKTKSIIKDLVSVESRGRERRSGNATESGPGTLHVQAYT